MHIAIWILLLCVYLSSNLVVKKYDHLRVSGWSITMGATERRPRSRFYVSSSRSKYEVLLLNAW